MIDAKSHPTESLVEPLRRSAVFGSGQPLHDRVTIIDPHPDFPPALNPFDIGSADDIPAEERDAFRTHTLDFLEHTFGGMFEFGFTPTQSICFIKAVDVVLATPNPNFRTLRDVLNDRGKDYLQYLNREQQYFINEELRDQYKARKGEINARLDFLLLRYPTLEKMFSAPTCKFNIGEEMDAGRVIILSTSRARLGEGCSMYGRLFINMIRTAAFRRKSSIPVYLYIDECHDYVATDVKLAQILDQCRSFNICPIFAHQRLGQLKLDDVREAVAQCAIKFANTEENAKELAPRFGLEDPKRLNLPQGQFAVRAGRKSHTNFPHSVMICEALASIELGMKGTPGLRFIPWQEIHKRMPEKTRNSKLSHCLPVSISHRIGGKEHHSSKALMPDAVFGIEIAGAGARFFALECDRDHEPLSRSNLEQTSYLRKILQYQQVTKDKTYKTHWGLPNLLALNLTTTQFHQNKIMELVLELTGGKGASYLLFNTMPSLGDFARPEPPTGRLFTQAWKRASYPEFFLSQP